MAIFRVSTLRLATTENMHTIRTITLDTKADAVLEAGVTEEYRRWFKNLVETHLSMFMWPNQNVHRLARAFAQNTDIPFAFCYYYVNPDTDHCELFGVYVDEPYRCQRTAENLIVTAISECAQNHCLSFALRFLSPLARSGRLVQNIRRELETQHPHTTAKLYFPNEPHVEHIGG